MILRGARDDRAWVLHVVRARARGTRNRNFNRSRDGQTGLSGDRRFDDTYLGTLGRSFRTESRAR